MAKSDERFLMRVVDMYYQQEMLQDEIAKKLNVSRTTVSRALSKAKKEGYIKIIIDFPAENMIELEKEMEKKFHLKEVIAVKVDDINNRDILVAREAAYYIARMIKNDMIIGIAWGYTMKKIIDAFDMYKVGSQIKAKNIEVVPLLGTMTPETADNSDLRLSYASLLSSKLAEMVNGISYYFAAPMYVKDIDTKKMLLEEPQIKNVMQKAKNCHAGIFGIGALVQNSSIAILEKDMILKLSKKNGVGEILGRVFDKYGNTVESEWNDRMIGLTLEQAKNIPIRVGVAFGEEKVKAIKTAISTNIINVLITDSVTAESILYEK
ncbi:MAG: sugar-binding transcriptional regulator [Firmicutes bacterium]|nr:sugar-binding transcriptional regulator [Bacillota bacterium]